MSERATPEQPSQDAPGLIQAPLPQVILAGSLSLLAGAAGTGKTALIATIARQFRDGARIFDHQPSPIPAIGFINADRCWADSAGHWFDRAGFPDIRYYSMLDDPTFDPKSLRRKWDRTNLLFQFVDKLNLPRQGLLFVDPMSLFLGGSLLDYDTVAVACCEIRAKLRERGLTLIGTAHTAKLKADKADRYLRLQDRILGSTALIGFTDTAMYLASPEEVQRPTYTFLWQPHTAPAETFDLERDQFGIFRLASGTDSTTAERVLSLFPEDGTAVTTRTLILMAEVFPLSRATVMRMLDELVRVGRVERVRHGVYRLSPPAVNLKLIKTSD
jgi:hypothetical protein